MLEHTNMIAILVAAIISVAVRNIWFSPLLFGSFLMKEIGATMLGEMSQTKNAFIATCKGIVTQSIFFFVAVQFVFALQKQGIGLLMSTGLLIVVLCSFSLNTVIWEKQTFTFFCINSVYLISVVFGGVGIIFFWPW